MKAGLATLQRSLQLLQVAALAALVPAAGCHWRQRPTPFYISRIAASEETLADNPGLGMDSAALKDRLVVALDATGRFVPLAGALDGGPAVPTGATANGKSHAYRCRVTVRFTRESDEPSSGSGDAGAVASPCAAPKWAWSSS